MCNCGNKRAGFKQPGKLLGSVAINNPVFFEYTGLSALTVIGPVSGKRYRFKNQGAAELIDVRDVQAMINTPVLKQISDRAQLTE